MSAFYNDLMNTIQTANSANAPKNKFIFGTIISGTYSSYKHDPHPTILCLGNYQKNGKWYVHGIQLHALMNAQLNWLMYLIKSMKQNSRITNPLLFFNYLKINNYSIIKTGYRTYHTELTDFKTIAPGLANVSTQFCYPISDSRDNYLVNNLNGVQPVVNQQQLRENIQSAINTVKVW